MNIKLKECILNFVFPPVCGLCKKISNSYLCEDCKRKLEKIEQNTEIKNCNEYIDRQFWIFEYKDEIRDRLIEYKFGDSSYLYRFFTEIILNNKEIVRYVEDFDYIIPVPLHRNRLRNRGYNQAELISKQISKNGVNVIFCNNLLKRAKNTRPQSLLNKDERALNIDGAFKINSSINLLYFQNKKILLFDDIYTTGATVTECAKVLKSRLNVSIGFFSIAKD